MDKTADILFGYLKNLLYYPEKAELQVEELPEKFQKLGKGLQFLNEQVQEERKFAKALAKGDISVEPPKVDNMLAMPIKELQGSLRHLAWQTQQVAKGDYSQKVDFMGEFSEAFNSMTEQLAERTEGVLREKRLVEQKNQELESMLDLTMALTNYTRNMIIVFSECDGRQVFENQPAEWFGSVYPERAEEMKQLLQGHGAEGEQETEKWNLNIELEMETQFFEVESFSVQWKEEPVRVHIVIDDTTRKKREQLFFSLAYVDPLTGLNNRRYAMDIMENWIKEGKEFLFSFIDVDYLKYCNDTYGHDAGDEYLITVVNALKTLPGELCRAGGDEFFFIIGGSNAEEREEQLSRIRDYLRNQKGSSYPRSFSFATIAVPADPEEPLERYIKRADVKMYQYKMKNKEKIEDILYRDERV